MPERGLPRRGCWSLSPCVLLLLPIFIVAASPGPAGGVNPDFYVPPTIPLNGSALWQVDGKINVCTSPWTPMVDCLVGTKGAPDKITGFYAELTKLTLKRIGWTENDYVFSCMDWDLMEADLYKSNGTCYMVAGGIALTVERAKKGMKFSWPNFHNELVILISATTVSSNIWGFLTPFTWELWVALITTGLLVGFLVWLAEWASTRREVVGSAFSDFTLECVFYSAWQAAGKIVQMTQKLDHVNTLAARIIVWTYGLLVMVVIATYTANTAAQLTAVSLKTSIHGLSDLRGKAVGTWDGYQRIFNGSNAQDYPFTPQYFPWNNKLDEAAMLSALRSGRIVALIIDKPFAQNKASSNCDLHVVGSPFEATDLALAFPKSFPDENLIDIISRASKANEEQWLVNPLFLRYFRYNDSASCPILKEDGAIGMNQMLGLWYILGGAMGISILCIAGTHLTWATGTNRFVAQRTRVLAQKSMAHTKKLGSMTRTRRSVTSGNSVTSLSMDGGTPQDDSIHKIDAKLGRLSIAIDKPSSEANGGLQDRASFENPTKGAASGQLPLVKLKRGNSNAAKFYGNGILKGGENKSPRNGRHLPKAHSSRSLGRSADDMASLERVAEWAEADSFAGPGDRELHGRILAWQEIMRRQQAEVESFLLSLRGQLPPSARQEPLTTRFSDDI